MEKAIYKGRKSKLKNQVLPYLFETMEGSMVVLNQDSGLWDVSIQTCFPLPAGMEVVQGSTEEDVKRKEIQAFIKEQWLLLDTKIKEYFQVSSEPLEEEDFNLTYIFPPSMITSQDGDFYRLKTKDEIEAIGNQAPTLKGMYERELQLLDEGYYEFIPKTSVEEYEIYAFRLKKYSNLRIRFRFSLPDDAVESFDSTIAKPIFQKTGNTAS